MEMKDNNNAPALDMPNNMAPKPYNQIHYGNQHVPRPTNNAAKVVNPEAVVRSFIEGK